MYFFMSIAVLCISYVIGQAINAYKDIKKYKIYTEKNDKIKEINL